MVKKSLYKILSSLLILLTLNITAQENQVIDKIIAVVGSNVILYSEIENTKLQMRAQGYSSANMNCETIEDLLYQKLLINQAAIDSIEVTEKEINSTLDQRLGYYINQIGSEEKLEEYYKKSLLEIKEDLRDIIKDQLISQRMQNEISGDVSVTPSEVRSFYKNIPKDSLPFINTELELEQIVLNPEINDSEIKAIKDKLNNFRERVKNGESTFSTLAVLYSEDPGSATNGGDLGHLGRGDLVEEFAAAAFNLDEGEISRIVKTDYGYHIIEMMEKRGERIRVRHILLKPKVAPINMIKAKNKLDSIADMVRKDSLTFKDAVVRYSDDKNTRANGGLLYNPMIGSSKFEISEIDPATYYSIKDLNTGDISRAFETQDENGLSVYIIMRIKSKTEPHKINLKNDYQKIQNLALEEIKQKYVDEWVNTKVESTYIKIDDEYKDCEYRFKGWIK